MFAYIGCRTTKERHARGEGICVYHITENGTWEKIQCIFNEANPSFQCLDNDKKYLYTVHGDIRKASSYKILEDGTLEYLNTVDFEGRNPVDITVDKENKHIIVATLQGGSFYTFERNEDGSIGKQVAAYSFEGKEDGKVSTIHQCLWDQKKNYLFGAAQGRGNGYGQFRALKYDHESGCLTETSRFMARTWDEPRHAAVHPNNKWVYMVEELGNKILFFEFDENNGIMKGCQEISTLPETELRQSEAAEIMVAPGGKYVLVSNRTTDTIAVFRIDSDTGFLKLSGHYPAMGKTPRYFCFAPDGKCYVAHEDSDTIAAFDFDSEAGKLSYIGSVIQTGSPVCLTFIGEKE